MVIIKFVWMIYPIWILSIFLNNLNLLWFVCFCGVMILLLFDLCLLKARGIY